MYSIYAGSNLILKGALDDYGLENPINFASWMQYAMLPMVINFVLCWLWLQMFYLGLPKKQDLKGTANVRAVIRQQYKELGPLNFHEASVLACFITLIILWFFRQPQFMTGWGDFFHTRCIY